MVTIGAYDKFRQSCKEGAEVNLLCTKFKNHKSCIALAHKLYKIQSLTNNLVEIFMLTPFQNWHNSFMMMSEDDGVPNVIIINWYQVHY